MGLDLEAGEGLVGVESLLFLGVAVICRGAAEAATIDDDGRGAAAAAAAELLLLLPASRRCDDDFDFDASVCLIAKGGKTPDCRARERERERAQPLPKSAESVALVFLGCPFTFLAPGRLLRRQSRLSIDFNVQPNMSLSLVAAPPQHMAESGGSSTPVPLLATVPAPPGTKRLHFCWGLGNRISLCPLVESPSAAAGVDADDFDAEPGQHYSRPAAAAAQAANAEPPSASVVQWCV